MSTRRFAIRPAVAILWAREKEGPVLTAPAGSGPQLSTKLRVAVQVKNCVAHYRRGLNAV